MEGDQMSGVIRFTSGKTLEITEKEFRAIAPKLKGGGIRLLTTKDQHLIPLNSNTMEIIEYVQDEPVEGKVIEKEPEVLPEQPTLPEGATPKKEETPESIEARKEKALAEMIEKSNCKHERDKLLMYRHDTAKGVRYFPVCTFCGKRERYVSEKKVRDGEIEGWTGEDIDNAKPWLGE